MHKKITPWLSRCVKRRGKPPNFYMVTHKEATASEKGIDRLLHYSALCMVV